HTFREELLAQQARVERLSTFGQLAGSIGHDLRNPLAAIETSVYLLRNLIGADERSKRHLDRIGEQVALANGIIANLLGIIRDRPLAKERVKLESVVGRAAEAVVRPQEVRLAVGALSGLEVEGDPGQLQQVFVNLFVNAVEAVSPRGDVMVNGILAGREVLVSVDDTGPGVSQAIARRLFEPLTSTKDKGVGLGLALVKRIVERHGGTVTYQRRAGGGARFLVHLPAWGAGG
ncbi:MAG TPA: HAMP domain-containing sensor histidine kinase, partial [Anaeromyxobacteraceae bacterium]|nr:HAMP domain-containing sensor histidine kinase [Anaeromyxobacteraceae bacterium]